MSESILPPEAPEASLGAAWRVERARPSERYAARLRAHAEEVIARDIPAHADAVRRAFASSPMRDLVVLEMLEVHEAGSSAVHDAVMTFAFLGAFDDLHLAGIVHGQLRRLVAKQRPGSPRWQALVRLAGLWRMRAEAATGPAPGQEDAVPDMTAFDLEEIPSIEEGEGCQDQPLHDWPARGERHVSVLDNIAPRNADRMADVEPFQTLVDGVPLRRFAREIDEIAGLLRGEFPWFAALIDDIESEWRLGAGMGRGWIRVRPILLHGPPGIGKSRFVARLAELSGTGHAFLSVSGSSDNRQLAGTAAGWSTAQPSWPAQMMLKLGCANPILMIDELDKTSEDRRNGRVIDTLLTMIEPETGRMWSDECLGGALDLTHVSWLMCANDLSLIDPTLRSRVRCIAVAGPDVTDFGALYRRMLEDIAREFDTDPALLPPLEPSVVAALARGFEQTRSIRRLRRALEIALGQQFRADAGRPN